MSQCRPDCKSDLLRSNHELSLLSNHWSCFNTGMVRRTCVLGLLLVLLLVTPVLAQEPTPLPLCTGNNIPAQLQCLSSQVYQVAQYQLILQQTLISSTTLLVGAAPVVAAPLEAGSVITGTLPSGGEVALRYEFTVGEVVLILVVGVLTLLLVLEVLRARLRGH